ncbi:MAG: hypothetical protein QOK16_2216 [Solirubrobacteraceae bacterium]|jgi:hypothetical protein|nr:hypothetical protein [Solirubrobacteraceae bacterium]
MTTLKSRRSANFVTRMLRGSSGREDESPGSSRRSARSTGRAPFAVVACALLVFFGAAAPAPAQVKGFPVQLTVIIVPPSSAPGPRPTGSVIVSLDDHQLLSIPLIAGLKPLTSITPQITVVLTLLGHRVKIRYSGDSNYEASTGIAVTLPTSSLLTIVARPRDAAPPAIEVVSPGDGAHYAQGEEVVVNYACHDPEDRSMVMRCEGPVTSGGRVDTETEGTFSFEVKTEDALGNAASKTVTYEVVGKSGAPAGAAPGGEGSRGSPPPPPPPPPPLAPPPATPPVAPPPAAPAVGTPGSGTPAAGPPTGAGVQSPSRRSSTPRPGSPLPGAAPKPASPTTGSSKPGPTSTVRQEFAPYDPRDDPAKTVAILIAAFTLLQLGTATGGLARARGGGGVVRTARKHSGGDDQPQADFAYSDVSPEFLGAGLGLVALGDRSRTWNWPGTRTLDALGATLPARLSRRSPLLARIAADGTYLRAILGSASLLGMLGGLALGVAAVRDTGGDALPPAAALTVAIAVLGVLDAAAGLVAVLTFAVGVLALGGVQSSADLRLMLTLGSLWFVVPVLAGAARPLRRPPTRSLAESWDRAADFVIASLIGAWAVQKIILSLPGLAGRQLPIAEHASTAAFCVLAALVVRLTFETIASHLYPKRLDMTEAGDVPQPGMLQQLGASALRTALFVFFAYIVVGASWQLWVGAALFVAPQILAVYGERFPNSPALYRALPKGLVRLVLMLFVGTAVGALLLRWMDEHSKTFLADTFVLLSLPGFLLSLLSLFGREGDQPSIGWGKRIAGIAILVAGVLLVLGLLL